MDTQSDSSGALDTNQAANLFADMLSPADAQAEVVEDKKPEKAEVEAEPTAEESQDTPEAEEDADDPVVTVKVNGQDLEVKLSELKRGYQKEASANEKFQQAAELRKTADAETQKALSERREYADKLQKMQTQLEILSEADQQRDWDQLLTTDPVEYLRQQRLAQERQATLQKVYVEQQQVQQAQQAEAFQRQQNYIARQQDELLQALPEWKDATKAAAEKTALKDYLLKGGWEPGTVDTITDAKAVILARKAMLFDQMVSKAQAASKKVSTLPTKVERPGTGDNPGLDKRSSAFQRLSKSGKVEDAAALFSSFV